MKFTLAPLVSLVFGASYLIANATAYSYIDYNELDARYQIDEVLSERGFGLEARETIDVPFQPSLRAFLEEAVTAHRRSMSEYENHLEARAMITVHANIPGSNIITLQVPPDMKPPAFKQAIKDSKKAPGFEPDDFVARLGWKTLDDSRSLRDNNVRDGVTTVDFVKKITVNAWVNLRNSNGCKKPKVKVDPDMMLPAFRAVVGKMGFDLNAYEARLVLGPKTGPEGKLDEFKTLRGNGVVEGSSISFQPMIEFPVSIVGREGTVVMKAATDLKVSAFKKLVEGKLGIDLGKYQARGADGKILSTLSTLRAAGVDNGTKVQYTPAV
ncbi:hypothetical protein D9611_005923 [Ephemerocybe angulata]|uniref:Uncharacterized protein n=1 Tax=Ephemerocybe angulata TaxID=980116 RepID=A0A8H5CGA3_9AGAR|nr:hypothetical protein D9611_005923 [Tulosesus angulatus]